jgi:hypothetical protein
MIEFIPIPSGRRLGTNLHKAMERLADYAINPNRRWKNYAEHVAALWYALDEVESTARAAKFAVGVQMKSFGLVVSKKEFEAIVRRADSHVDRKGPKRTKPARPRRRKE